jgi:DNA replication initiation complex subunit (GINS family)
MKELEDNKIEYKKTEDIEKKREAMQLETLRDSIR